MCFFFTRILPRLYQNSGHTGVCFFFTRILPRPYQNSGFFNFTYRSVFLFHQNFTVMGPKFRIFDFTYRSMILFHQNFTLTIPKFRVFKKETYFHFEKESTCDQNQLPILISKGQPRPTVTTGNFVFCTQKTTSRGEHS